MKINHISTNDIIKYKKKSEIQKMIDNIPLVESGILPREKNIFFIIEEILIHPHDKSFWGNSTMWPVLYRVIKKCLQDLKLLPQ